MTCIAPGQLYVWDDFCFYIIISCDDNGRVRVYRSMDYISGADFAEFHPNWTEIVDGGHVWKTGAGIELIS